MSIIKRTGIGEQVVVECVDRDTGLWVISLGLSILACGGLHSVLSYALAHHFITKAQASDITQFGVILD